MWRAQQAAGRASWGTREFLSVIRLLQAMSLLRRARSLEVTDSRSPSSWRAHCLRGVTPPPDNPSHSGGSDAPCVVARQGLAALPSQGQLRLGWP